MSLKKRERVYIYFEHSHGPEPIPYLQEVGRKKDRERWHCKEGTMITPIRQFIEELGREGENGR